VLRLPPRVVCLPSGSTESKMKSKVEAHRHLQHVADVQQDIYMHSVPRLCQYTSIILVDGELIKHTHTQVGWSASAGSGGVALTTVRLVSPRRQELSSRVVPVPEKARREIWSRQAAQLSCDAAASHGGGARALTQRRRRRRRRPMPGARCVSGSASPPSGHASSCCREGPGQATRPPSARCCYYYYATSLPGLSAVATGRGPVPCLAAKKYLRCAPARKDVAQRHTSVPTGSNSAVRTRS
jgi:hypothetical protein